MRPTPHLRFVERRISVTMDTSRDVRILQQWWTTSQWITADFSHNPDGCIGEWRDIELVQE